MAVGDGSITVTVIQDVNGNGSYDAASEEGVPGVEVAVEDLVGDAVTGTTDADGLVTLDPTPLAGSRYRVRVSTEGTGMTPAPAGGDLRPLIDYVDVTGGSNAELTMGLIDPAEYVGTPRILVAEERAAINSFDPNTGPPPTQGALWSMDYEITGEHLGDGSDVKRKVATLEQVGSVYGVAAIGEEYALSASLFKRHTRVGPGGVGAVYLSDLTTGEPNAEVFVEIPNAGNSPRGTADADPLGGYDWFHDEAAWPLVTKIGLGDIDITPDESTLYATNLNDRQLYAVPVTEGVAGPEAGTPTEIAIPLDAMASCASDQVVPFAVHADDDAVYVGVTCTGPTADDLAAAVLVLDRATETFAASPAFEIDLDYPRGCTWTHGGGCGLSATWNAWTDDFQPASYADRQSYPEPILSDIEFVDDGDLVLAFRDRFGDKQGWRIGSPDPADNANYFALSGGDILRACGNQDTGWELEDNASCGELAGWWPNSGRGPGGGEFYKDEWRDGTGSEHHEVLAGGLMQVPG